MKTLSTTAMNKNMAKMDKDGLGPFVHKYETERNKYIYDVNSGELLSVDNVIWTIIEDSYSKKNEVLEKYTPQFTINQIEKAYDEIHQSRREEGYFCDDYPEIEWQANREHIQKNIMHKRSQLTLNVTEQCNFRCSYCPHTLSDSGLRDHGSQHMSWEIAQTAIDDFLEHSRVYMQGSVPPEPNKLKKDSERSDNETDKEIYHSYRDKRRIDLDTVKYRIHIGYYGGEPLLNFKLIKRCTEYILKKLGNRSKWVSFGLSTNGYLLKGEIAEFLAKHNFNVRVSLDGPADIHDRQRCLVDNSKTWNVVKNNIQDFIKRVPHKPPSIAAVISYTEDLGKACEYLSTASWIPPLSTVRCTPAADPWPGYRKETTPDDFKMEKLRRKHLENLIKSRVNLGSRHEEIEMHRLIFDDGFGAIHRERWMYANSRRRGHHYFNPSGVCIPGAVRQFVSVNGDYYPCEKVIDREEYCIGNIATGIDTDKSITLMKDFIECTQGECSRCWCISVCPIRCWSSAPGPKGQFRIDKKRICEMVRRDMHAAFVQYCYVLENNPEAFDYLGETAMQDQKILKRLMED